MDNKTFMARTENADSCAISDALDALSMPPAVSGIRRLATSSRIAGRIITVKLAAGMPDGGSKRHLCTGAIEAADNGDIIVIEQLTGIDAAGWGGVLSRGALTAGVQGVIVEGPARDIDEAAALAFPVYAREATARTARNRIHEAEFNGPVEIGGITVQSGDYVVADSSGIAFIPAAQVETVLATAERIADREQLMIAALERGDRISEVMGSDYETMLKR